MANLLSGSTQPASVASNLAAWLQASSPESGGVGSDRLHSRHDRLRSVLHGRARRGSARRALDAARRARAALREPPLQRDPPRRAADVTDAARAAAAQAPGA